MILFDDIYKKAITLFDDPKITYAYNTNKIAFSKYMYAFLETVSIFEPVIIGQILAANTVNPKGELELIDGDGVHNEFELEIVIPEGAHTLFTEKGEVVEAEYNRETNTVIFPHVLNNDEEYGVEYYQSGSFNTNFSSITSITSTMTDIQVRVTNILARLIVIAWAESTRDMLVDIQGLLRDTDFKATPNSQILNSKVNWVKELQRRNQADQVKLSWYLRYSSGVAKFKR